MHFFYIDDSKDEKLCVFSALSIPGDQWRNAFQAVKEFRAALKKSEDILLRVEFHATDFVAGRGKLGPKIVPKGRRCAIFHDALDMITQLPGVSLINACVPKDQEGRAFERLLNRINTAVQYSGTQAIVISDKGKENEYTRLARRMAVINFIPSQFGQWPSGESRKNIPIERVLEDIVFKDSKSSYFIQLADFCAYSLLRRERPLQSKNKYKIHESFCRLDPILNKNANRKDPDGIIRI